MRTLGINYDTGFWPGNRSSRTSLAPEVIRQEMQVIARELHCDAVRISGSDPDRLSLAGDAALDAGLDIWFAPFPTNLPLHHIRPILADCARRAEDLRTRSAHEVVLVLGCELSVSAEGFLPGGDIYARLTALTAPPPELFASYTRILQQLNDFLGESVRLARQTFGGRITYASGTWEQVDWSPFDIVGIDAYRDAANAATFGEHLRGYVALGKPVAATEFGCCTYHGAAARGGAGWTIIDQSVEPRRLNGTFERDEDEQVRYLRELVDVFESAGLDSAFWFTFAGYELPHRADPVYDLDMASYGVVKVTEPDSAPGLGWERKAAFTALAELAASRQGVLRRQR